jgi:dihydrofolate synthase/folylpolyglutamate synthase
MPPVTPGSLVTELERNCFPLAFHGTEISVDFPLQGRHQLRNLALAITAADQLNSFGVTISPQDVERGVRNTRWPGRFEVLPAKDGFPEIVLDVAHNPAGGWALRSALSTFYPDRPLTFVFGVMRDKAIQEIADILFPLAERVIATQAENPRAASPAEIAAIAQRSGTETMEEPDVPAALERARLLAGTEGVVVITGSIYIVGEALGELSRAQLRQGVGTRA